MSAREAYEAPLLDSIKDLRAKLAAALKERDEARAQLKAAVAAHEEADAMFHEAADACDRGENFLADAIAERDRLLAALMAVVGDGGVDGGEHYECRGEACERARAAIRAKAGLP